MHIQHRKCVNSLAGYKGEAMYGCPIRHAFIMAGKSFDIPAILFYLVSDATKSKREDDGPKKPASIERKIMIAANAVLGPQWV